MENGYYIDKNKILSVILILPTTTTWGFESLRDNTSIRKTESGPESKANYHRLASENLYVLCFHKKKIQPGSLYKQDLNESVPNNCEVPFGN